MDQTASFETIDEYIALFPKPVQKMMQEVRKTISQAAPEAVECISYKMPTFKMKRNLVHFAAYKHHIGFYPGAGGIDAFQDEIKQYKNAKGSVQFPIDEPMPLELIKKVTTFRVKQEMERVKK